MEQSAAMNATLRSIWRSKAGRMADLDFSGPAVRSARKREEQKANPFESAIFRARNDGDDVRIVLPFSRISEIELPL